MKFNAFELISYFFLAIWVVAEIFIFKWMFRAKPDKKIIEKYPKKIILLSQLPFGKRWKKNIDQNDVRFMQTYQYRIRVWFLSIMIGLYAIPLGFILYIIIDWHVWTWNR